MANQEGRGGAFLQQGGVWGLLEDLYNVCVNSPK